MFIFDKQAELYYANNSTIPKGSLHLCNISDIKTCRYWPGHDPDSSLDNPSQNSELLGTESFRDVAFGRDFPDHRIDTRVPVDRPVDRNRLSPTGILAEKIG